MAASSILEVLTEPSEDKVELKEQPVTRPKTKTYKQDGLEAIYVSRPKNQQYDKAAYDRIATWVTYKIENPDITNAEIAVEMGISRTYLQHLIHRANSEGWLKYDSPSERLENEIVPKAVDNVAHFINNKDKTMTIEVMKGTGLFRSYQSVKNDGEGNQTVLALKIETVDAAPKVITGHVVGKAREIDDT